jgi:RsiW-degrading membrane proteinase PrsW (M82 family)
LRLLDHRRLDPLLLGSPLRRTPVAVAVALVLLAVLAVVTAAWLGLLASLRPDVAGIFFTAFGLSSLMSLVPLAILWFLDRRERETPWLFAVAFLWGGFIATGLALPVNNAILRGVARWVERHPVVVEVLGPQAPTLLGAPLAGPIVEELTKGLGLLALFFFLRAEFDNMRDGFVYGALIGAGFTWFEAPLYVAHGYAESATAPWGAQFGWRYALFGLGGHAMFSALFGAALGLALQTRRVWLTLLAPVVGLALAIGAHAFNNVLPLLVALAGAAAGEGPPPGGEGPPVIGLIQAWLLGSAVGLTLFLPFVAIMATALWRSGVWERRVIRDELALEVPGAVTPIEYEQVRRDSMFRTRRIDGFRPELSAAIVNAQHELAFRKRRARAEGVDPERDPLVAAWREEIRLLRDARAQGEKTTVSAE